MLTIVNQLSTADLEWIPLPIQPCPLSKGINPCFWAFAKDVCQSRLEKDLFTLYMPGQRKWFWVLSSSLGRSGSVSTVSTSSLYAHEGRRWSATRVAYASPHYSNNPTVRGKGRQTGGVFSLTLHVCPVRDEGHSVFVGS